MWTFCPNVRSSAIVSNLSRCIHRHERVIFFFWHWLEVLSTADYYATAPRTQSSHPVLVIADVSHKSFGLLLNADSSVVMAERYNLVELAIFFVNDQSFVYSAWNSKKWFRFLMCIAFSYWSRIIKEHYYNTRWKQFKNVQYSKCDSD